MLRNKIVKIALALALLIAGASFFIVRKRPFRHRHYAPESISLIDPQSDTVSRLFVKEHPPRTDFEEAEGINFEKEARRFGIIEGVAPSTREDKVVLLPNGLSATANRNSYNSSVFFFDAEKKRLAGIIHPTLPNRDIALCAGTLFMINDSSTTIVNYEKMKPIADIPVGGARLLCWENEKLYATIPAENAVAVIDMKTFSIRKLKAGLLPKAVWKCRQNKICVENAREYYED